MKQLPFVVPPFLEKGQDGQEFEPKHSEAAWIFFGRNDSSKPLGGRADHTDDIEHSGTWHIQLHGTKVWTLHPTVELCRQNRSWKAKDEVQVRCKPGDVLCINTRLWWHRTHIPGKTELCMSVARDMYLDGTEPETPDFTNVRGHYATKVFQKDAVVFTEDDAPDLELPRSRNSNCGLRDMCGQLIVIAKRRITPGEWFSISESEYEDDEPRQKRSRKS